MSDAAPISRDEERLARLAELDLAAAEKAHARLMTAEDSVEIAEFGRTFQRMAQSLRQTLALKTKLQREIADHERWLRARGPSAPAPNGWKTDHRLDELLEAAGRVIAATTSDEDAQAGLYDRLDRELDDWTEEDDFTTADLDELVWRACGLLGLAPDLARAWRTLPEPAYRPDPAEAHPEPVYARPTLRRDSS